MIRVAAGGSTECSMICFHGQQEGSGLVFEGLGDVEIFPSQSQACPGRTAFAEESRLGKSW